MILHNPLKIVAPDMLDEEEDENGATIANPRAALDLALALQKERNLKICFKVNVFHRPFLPFPFVFEGPFIPLILDFLIGPISTKAIPRIDAPSITIPPRIYDP